MVIKKQNNSINNENQSGIVPHSDEILDLRELFILLTYQCNGNGSFRFNTLNPVNQYAYDDQYVSYLEEIFNNLPDEQILCASNKATFRIDGVGIRMSNKSQNPSHLKYSMTPTGEINSNFERHFDEIVKNEQLEKLLSVSKEKLDRLRMKKGVGQWEKN